MTFLHTCASETRWTVFRRLLWIQGSWNPREGGGYCPTHICCNWGKSRPGESQTWWTCTRDRELAEVQAAWREKQVPRRQDREEFGGRGEGGSWGASSLSGPETSLTEEVDSESGESLTGPISPQLQRFLRGDLCNWGREEREGEADKNNKGHWQNLFPGHHLWDFSRRSALRPLGVPQLEDPPPLGCGHAQSNRC